MFCHNPNKEQQNWTVEDAVAHKGGASEEMKFQCPSEGRYKSVSVFTAAVDTDL
jgi:putative lipoic acid-binding regulatory protein